MREIKFRALIEDLQDHKTYWEFYSTLHDPAWTGFSDIKIIVKDLQFTGLFDKNGKEIYEGDIIRGNGNNLFAIIPMLGGLSICNTHYLGQKHNELISEPTNDAQSAQWLKESEVIGNVYEHPDLLKGE